MEERDQIINDGTQKESAGPDVEKNRTEEVDGAAEAAAVAAKVSGKEDEALSSLLLLLKSTNTAPAAKEDQVCQFNLTFISIE